MKTGKAAFDCCRLTTLLAFALLGCHSALQPSNLPAPRRVERVVRQAVPPDRVAFARNEGSLHVVVREADYPDTSVPQARVRIRWRVAGVADSLVQNTDPAGVAVFSGLQAGDYIASIRRIGFDEMEDVPIRIDAGCGTVVDVYLGLRFLCLGDCPPTPNRAVVSGCRPRG